MFGSKPKQEIDHEATRAKLLREVDKAIAGRLLQIAYHLDVKPVYKPLPTRCSCNGCVYLRGGCYCCACCNSKRPYFGPKQIRCLCQVQKGRRYIRKGAGQSNTPLTAISDPYPDSIGWRVDIEGRGIRNDHICLGDHNVAPYRGGSWTKSGCWLEFAEEDCCFCSPLFCRLYSTGGCCPCPQQ